MSEYTNELYMQLTRANRTANLAIGAGIRGVLFLYQFISRMEKEGILKGGEVLSMEKFLKATEGKYDIMNVPYAAADAALSGSIRPEALEKIKGSLDASGIRYCVLPDMNPADHRVQIAVFREDAQKFSAFYTGYLRSFLTGGKKEYADLLNFTDGSANIVSIPDEAKEAMEGALAKLKVDWAPLPDLNLKDGEFQISVASHNTDTVLRAYKLYQEGLLTRGSSLKDARVMTEDDYKETAKLTADAYVEMSDKALLEKSRTYDADTAPEKERAIRKADGNMMVPDTFSFASHIKDPEYTAVSVDCATLVDDSSARIMMERYPNLFFCRIPGTKDESEKLLAVSKLHAFLIEDAAKPRFIVFVNRVTPPSVIGRAGSFQDKDLEFSTAEKLLERFDSMDPLRIPAAKAASLSHVPFPPPVK